MQDSFCISRHSDPNCIKIVQYFEENSEHISEEQLWELGTHHCLEAEQKIIIFKWYFL